MALLQRIAAGLAAWAVGVGAVGSGPRRLYPDDLSLGVEGNGSLLRVIKYIITK